MNDDNNAEYYSDTAGASVATVALEVCSEGGVPEIHPGDQTYCDVGGKDEDDDL